MQDEYQRLASPGYSGTRAFRQTVIQTSSNHRCTTRLLSSCITSCKNRENCITEGYETLREVAPGKRQREKIECELS